MLLTLANLKALLDKHGIPFASLAINPRVTCASWGRLDAPLQIELRLYLLNDRGKRYRDDETGEAAVEVRRIPFEVLTIES